MLLRPLKNSQMYSCDLVLQNDGMKSDDVWMILVVVMAAVHSLHRKILRATVDHMLRTNMEKKIYPLAVVASVVQGQQLDLMAIVYCDVL